MESADKIFIIIPCYNEAETIFQVVEQTRPYGQVVVVDDSSTDQSALLAGQAGAVVLRHFLNRGQGAAEQTGTDLAIRRGADIIIHLDADGQHDPNDIPKLIAPLQSRMADIVLGSRFLGQAVNIPIFRKILLKAGAFFIFTFTGLRLSDSQNGFRAMTRSTAKLINITQDGMAHATEIIDQISEQDLRYQEVPVTVRYTPYSIGRGQSNSNAVKIVWRLIIEKFF